MVAICFKDWVLGPIGAVPSAMTGLAQSTLPLEPAPTFRGFQLEIPAGFQVLAPISVLVETEQCASDAIDKACLFQPVQRRLVQGVLLCRLETDRVSAVQQYRAHTSLEAALMGPDGQYRQDAQSRPAFAVLLRDTSNQEMTGQSFERGCVVLSFETVLEGSQVAVSPRTVLIVNGQVMPWDWAQDVPYPDPSNGEAA